MMKKLKTTPNQAVQTFITYGNQKGNRQLKEDRLRQLEEVLAFYGIYPGGKVHRGVLPTKRRYYTLSKFQPKKVEFPYAKESTFKFLLAKANPTWIK